MKKIVITLFLALISLVIKSQVLKGIIADEKNLPIPFATIYIEDEQTGTTANSNGEYQIKLNAGKHSVIFKSLGFKEIKKEVNLFNTSVTLNINLTTELYEIKEVTVTSKGEDPAYGIMRRTIALAPFHLRQIKHYESFVYLRGTIYIDKVPKLLSNMVNVSENGQTVKLKTGDVYSEESMLDITFNAPRFYQRTVKSIRTSFPGKSTNPVNPVAVIEGSFYEPEILDMTSPLAPEAFQHYNFKYHGYSQEGDFIVDKIEVIPKRKSQELFSGFIYIVDGDWCLYSLNLNVYQFWGDLNIRGVYGLVAGTAWLPVSYRFDVNGSYLGVKGRYKYSTAIKYTNTVLNDKLAATVKPKSNTSDDSKPKVAEKQEKIKERWNKDKLTNRDMKKVSKDISAVSALQKTDTLTQQKISEMTKRTVDSLATKHDTSFWSDIRPTPLTAEEIKSFEEGPNNVIQKVKKDSIKMAQDSTYNPNKKKQNYLWPITGRKFNCGNGYLNYRGLIQPSNLSFNTVDGFVYGLDSEFWDVFKNYQNTLTISPYIGYAFSRKKLMWNANLEFIYDKNTNHKGIFKMSGGNKTFDFNTTGISPFMNSVYSLFLKKNYMKLYNKEYFQISHYKSFKGLWAFTLGFEYSRLTSLENYSDFSFNNKNSKEYTPNIPENSGYNSTTSEYYKNCRVTAALDLSPRAKPKGDGYNREYNPYPNMFLIYNMGIPDVWGSNSDYQNLTFIATKRYWLGRNRIFKYKAHASYWISSKDVPFSEFTEIQTNYIPVSLKQLDYSYQLLPYYASNTNDWCVGAHLQYQTKLLILKRLPIISNRLWTENLYFNYLYTPATKNYTEFGYTLGQLWAFAEFGCFVSFKEFKYNSVGLKFSFDMK
jgi:hypothetical protein